MRPQLQATSTPIDVTFLTADRTPNEGAQHHGYGIQRQLRLAPGRCEVRTNRRTPSNWWIAWKIGPTQRMDNCPDAPSRPDRIRSMSVFRIWSIPIRLELIPTQLATSGRKVQLLARHGRFHSWVPSSNRWIRNSNNTWRNGLVDLLVASPFSTSKLLEAILAIRGIDSH